jgi:hypothetical protein
MSFQFEEGSGFSAFALYNAVKLHFTSDSYDFFKYGGKTNVSKSNFATRKDRYSFYKLSRKYNLQELRDFYVANFLKGGDSWVGEMANEEGESNYREWQKRNQRLTYQFEQDIIGLFNAVSTPNDLLMVRDGQYPLLLKEVMEGTITIETLVILNDIMNFLPMWDKKINDTIIWPDWKRKVVKYTPFLNYDKDKFLSILKESLKEYAD